MIAEEKLKDCMFRDSFVYEFLTMNVLRILREFLKMILIVEDIFCKIYYPFFYPLNFTLY